jgi:iron complex outermembrane receptor protein
MRSRNSAGQIVCRINQLTNHRSRLRADQPVRREPLQPRPRPMSPAIRFQTTNNDQHNAAANVNGSLFDLPAGPLSVAIGAEYRRESISGGRRGLAAERLFRAQRLGGRPAMSIVKEAYGEGDLPVLKESALGYSLNFNGAIRRTDYSTSGAVTTWKFGGVYEPIRGIRLRATKSRDIRAPNLFELNGPRSRRRRP